MSFHHLQQCLSKSNKNRQAEYTCVRFSQQSAPSKEQRNLNRELRGLLSWLRLTVSWENAIKKYSQRQEKGGVGGGKMAPPIESGSSNLARNPVESSYLPFAMTLPQRRPPLAGQTVEVFQWTLSSKVPPPSSYLSLVLSLKLYLIVRRKRSKTTAAAEARATRRLRGADREAREAPSFFTTGAKSKRCGSICVTVCRGSYRWTGYDIYRVVRFSCETVSLASTL